MTNHGFVEKTDAVASGSGHAQKKTRRGLMHDMISTTGKRRGGSGYARLVREVWGMNQRSEYKTQGRIPKEGIGGLLHRLRGVCDSAAGGGTPFREHEMILTMSSKKVV